MVITSCTQFAYKKTKSSKNIDPHLAHLEPAKQLKKNLQYEQILSKIHEGIL